MLQPAVADEPKSSETSNTSEGKLIPMWRYSIDIKAVNQFMIDMEGNMEMTVFSQLRIAFLFLQN